MNSWIQCGAGGTVFNSASATCTATSGTTLLISANVCDKDGACTTKRNRCSDDGRSRRVSGETRQYARVASKDDDEGDDCKDGDGPRPLFGARVLAHQPAGPVAHRHRCRLPLTEGACVFIGEVAQRSRPSCLTDPAIAPP